MDCFPSYVHIIDAAIAPTAVSQTIYDRIKADSEFSLFIGNIAGFVGLTDLVDRDLPLTILAPNNEAWGTASRGEDFIKRHIFRGLLFSDVIANVTEIVSVEGDQHDVELRGEELWVGGGFIYKSDILARTGVLHYVDCVLGEPETTFPSNAPTTPEPTPSTSNPTSSPSSLPTILPCT